MALTKTIAARNLLDTESEPATSSEIDEDSDMDNLNSKERTSIGGKAPRVNTSYPDKARGTLLGHKKYAFSSHYKSPDVPKGLPQTAGADESLALPNTTATSPSLTQILWRLERLERFRVEDAPLKQTMKHLKLRIDTLYEQNAHLKAKLRLIRTRVKRMANCIEDLEIRGVPRTRKRSRRSIQ